MSNYYSSNPKLYVGIDCIIFGFNEGELNLLLLKRNFEPAMGEWSLMGGFVQEDESVDDAAKRVLNELTGLEDVYMEQVQAFGAIDRDPGERVVSIVYYAITHIQNTEPNPPIQIADETPIIFPVPTRDAVDTINA